MLNSFENYLKQFKTDEPDIALKAHIMESVQDEIRKEKTSSGWLDFVKNWRWELSLSTVCVIAFVFNFFVYEISLNDYGSRPSYQIDMDLIEDIASGLCDSEEMASYILRNIQFIQRQSIYQHRAMNSMFDMEEMNHV